MRTELFDFNLPEDRIALEPAEPRGAARLLVVRPRAQPPCEDRAVGHLPDLLRPGDALIFNDTRVIAAALTGWRYRGNTAGAGFVGGSTGSRIGVNLHKRLDGSRWAAFARPARRLKIGDRLRFGDDARVGSAGSLEAMVDAKGEAGEVTLSFSLHGAALDTAIARHGAMPLPPYIASKRRPDARDRQAYQTVYARHDGAVAAPTAGLHFTDDLLAALSARGISQHFVTLHVGAGTFLPVKAQDTDGHHMHSEWCEIGAETAAALNEVRAGGGRLIAVGTTSLRLLESACRETGRMDPFSGDTSIFITPGYSFKGADLLMTNFHLPRSTLFMLVAAFSGLDVMKAAYQHAIDARYRFYSYGDACLLHLAGAQT